MRDAVAANCISVTNYIMYASDLLSLNIV